MKYLVEFNLSDAQDIDKFNIYSCSEKLHKSLVEIQEYMNSETIPIEIKDYINKILVDNEVMLHGPL